MIGGSAYRTITESIATTSSGRLSGVEPLLSKPVEEGVQGVVAGAGDDPLLEH